MPVTSAIEIVNLALDHLGDDVVSSIENPTIGREEHAARHYDQARRASIRNHVWNFAQRYVELAREGDGDAGYEDRYQQPTTQLRLNCVGEDRQNPITDYLILGDEIHVDNSGGVLPIYYNIDVEDVTKFDALFIDYFSLNLAARLAYKVQKKEKNAQALWERAESILVTAKSVDGQENKPVRIEKSKYLTARRRGGTVSQDNRYYNVW